MPVPLVETTCEEDDLLQKVLLHSSQIDHKTGRIIRVHNIKPLKEEKPKRHFSISDVTLFDTVHETPTNGTTLHSRIGNLIISGQHFSHLQDTKCKRFPRAHVNVCENV